MATSSETTVNIDLKLPTRWEDLTEKQLRYLFGLLAQDFPATQIKTYCLFRWSGMQVMCRYGKGWWCKFDKNELRKRDSGCVSAILNKFRLRSTCTVVRHLCKADKRSHCLA